ncbi:putative argonaute 12 [Senna tora]|uniref:Putative argonaute 12 n=1 Tax=Senna tora TaxID=362788 RepID=A0A835CM72_9FABA|nr:putative argonaute 12 [Senna tora]
MDCFEASLMLLPVLDDTDTTSIPSSSNHHHVPDIEFDELCDLVSFQVQLNGVICLYQWVGISDGAPIIGVQIRNSLLSKLNRTNLAKLKLRQVKENQTYLSLFIPYRVETETTLGIIEKPEVFIGLNAHTHETDRIRLVCPNLAINKNMALHQDGNNFSICEGILQSVSQYKDQRKALP